MNVHDHRFALLACLLIAAPVASPANLLQNMSFETESSLGFGRAMNWTMNDPDDHGDSWGSASRENWRAREGSFLGTIRGTWANAGDYGGWWQEAEVEGGNTYRFSAWFYADEGWGAALQEIKIEFWSWDRSQMLGSASNRLEGLGPDWKQLAVEGLAPEGSGWARVVINVSGAGPNGALQFDNVALELVPKE